MRKTRLFLALAALMLGMASPGWAQSEVGENTFFIKNVSEGTFLTGGNEWGTHASLDAHGLDCTLELSDGAYTIMTGNDQYLQATGFVDGKTAAVWTITPVSGQQNTYTIANADGSYLVATSGSTDLSLSTDAPTSSLGWWQFYTQDDMKNSLDWDNASESNPQDVSFYIDGCNFVRNCDGWQSGWRTATTVTYGPWAYTATSDGNLTVSGPSGKTQTNTGCEMWNQKFTLTQKVTVPNGKYKLTVDGFSVIYNAHAYIIANDNKNTFTKVYENGKNEHSFADAMLNISNYKEAATVTVEVTNGSLTVGVGRDDTGWCVIDNFRLYYIGALSGTQTLAEDVSSYEGTIPTAAYEELKSIVENENGTYTDLNAYNNALETVNQAKATADELVAPYAAAKAMLEAVSAIDDDASAYTDNSGAASTLQDVISNTNIEEMTTADELTDATSELKNAATDFLSAVTIKSDIDVTNIYVINPSFETGDATGWTLTAKDDAGVYPNTNGIYTISPIHGNFLSNAWQREAGTVSIVHNAIEDLPAGTYNLTAALASFAGRDLVMSATGTEEKTLTYNTGTNAKGTAVDVTIEGITVESTLTFGVSATIPSDSTEAFVKSDNWRLYITAEPALVLDEEETEAISETGTHNVLLKRSLVAGWNSIVLPFEVSEDAIKTAFGEGTEVATFVGDGTDNDGFVLNYTTVKTIPANTPCLLYLGAAVENPEFDGVELNPSESLTASGTNFDFVGTYTKITDQTIASGDYLVNASGIFKANGGNTLKAFRAYIDSKSASARSVRLNIDGTTTGISSVSDLIEGNAPIYNLKGQRVSNAQLKGVYISDGHKKLMK